MTLPSTITTKHGEYKQTVSSDTINTYINKKKEVGIYWVDEPLQEYEFVGMTPDEVIEFLQAYKEAGNE